MASGSAPVRAGVAFEPLRQLNCMPPNAPAPRPVSDRSGLLQRRRLARTARTLAQGRATPREDRLPVDADAELSKGPALR